MKRVMRGHIKKAIAFLCVFAALAPTFSARAASPHWADGLLQAWRDKGILHGAELRPDDPVTPAEAASLLTAAWPVPTSGELAGGSVPRVSREQAAAALFDVFSSSLRDVSKRDFTDFDAVSAGAENAVAVLAGNGVLSGYPDGRVLPDRDITRAEYITLLDRLLRLAAQNGASVTVRDAEGTAAAHISEKEPDAGAGDTGDMSVVELGKDAAGLRAAALFRFNPPAGIPASAVRGAYFYIRLKSGGAPALRALEMTQSWYTVSATWADAAAGISREGATGLSEDAGDGWYKIDVTDLVKGWLSGETNNNGFAVEESRSGESAEFYSVLNAEDENCPKLVVAFTPAPDGERYGKYAYDVQINGNCMSYALRDHDMILYDDLFNTEALQSAYDAGGENGALAYVKAQVLDYAEQHKDALKITAIRELSGPRAELDAENEYRIALRIGFRDRSVAEGIQVDEDFDYHFWAQLADGGWAEKTPQEGSRRVPGSSFTTDPGEYPWHQGYMWGYEKWNNYYTSDVAYFAVTKAVDTFTDHRT
ncbi:MAG: DNRLRE domain-containing protein [Oscillospiraceae bacterium]|nr:DNRLRE domain-containing protein [Oscillospiraceae bacterium]